MQPIVKVLSVALLITCIIAAVTVAEHTREDIVSQITPCDSPYKNRIPTDAELAVTIESHKAWLASGRESHDERRANLCQANLEGADLRGAQLQDAELVRANLQNAFLHGANLQGANLFMAHIGRAMLSSADLREGHLFMADLFMADLAETNLEGADLRGAQLQGADLTRARLQGADLMGADLLGAIYEPEPESLPHLWTLVRAKNLEAMVFRDSPAALVALREAFKKAGLRTQERQITYALEHTKRLQAWGPSWPNLEEEDMRSWLERFAGKCESLFSYVFFEFPSGYGMAPRRALQTLCLLMALFSIPYMVAVTARGPAGIWMIWLPDRVHKEEGEAAPVRVTSTFFFSAHQERAAGRWWGSLWRQLSIALTGLYFSLLSACSLGWRELNIGAWIARVQPREYSLRATGWVRTVSGIQSLLSIYLLALWALTYFSRPFE
jgi:Pentapeptide repeats (8 copies)